MKTESIISVKSFLFALKIIKTHRIIIHTHREFILSKQLLRSGTSIGANVAEGLSAFSRKDFEFKISIAYKEARETVYWLKLLEASHIIDLETFDELILDLEELQRLLGSTLVTLRKNQK
jgi:four helix bundle protein